jgi:hypothetical protein
MLTITKTFLHCSDLMYLATDGISRDSRTNGSELCNLSLISLPMVMARSYQEPSARTIRSKTDFETRGVMIPYRVQIYNIKEGNVKYSQEGSK